MTERWVILYSLQGSVGLITHDADAEVVAEFPSFDEAEASIRGHLLDGPANLHYIDLNSGRVEFQGGVCP